MSPTDISGTTPFRNYSTQHHNRCLTASGSLVQSWTQVSLGVEFWMFSSCLHALPPVTSHLPTTWQHMVTSKCDCTNGCLWCCAMDCLQTGPWRCMGERMNEWKHKMTRKAIRVNSNQIRLNVNNAKRHVWLYAPPLEVKAHQNCHLSNVGCNLKVILHNLCERVVNYSINISVLSYNLPCLPFTPGQKKKSTFFVFKKKQNKTKLIKDQWGVYNEFQ